MQAFAQRKRREGKRDAFGNLKSPILEETPIFTQGEGIELRARVDYERAVLREKKRLLQETGKKRVGRGRARKEWEGKGPK